MLGMTFADFFRGTQARLVHMMYAPSFSFLYVDIHDASDLPFHFILPLLSFTL